MHHRNNPQYYSHDEKQRLANNIAGAAAPKLPTVIRRPEYLFDRYLDDPPGEATVLEDKVEQ